jgi:flotillin
MTGFGGASGGVQGGDKSTINQVVDSVLSMALQLPAIQKLGEEVGMNIGDGVRGISNSLNGKSTGDAPDTSSDKAFSDKKG